VPGRSREQHAADPYARQCRTCDAGDHLAAAASNACRPCIGASGRRWQNGEIWWLCRVLVLLRKKPRFGSFPLLGYLRAYRKLLSASYGVPPCIESLATVGRRTSALPSAVALSFTLGPILTPAIFTPSIFISPIRHLVSPKQKGPRKGQNQLLESKLIRSAASQFPVTAALRHFHPRSPDALPGFFFSPNYEWMIVRGWNPEGHPPFVDRKPRPGAFPPWELDPRPGLLLLKSGVNFPP